MGRQRRAWGTRLHGAGSTGGIKQLSLLTQLPAAAWHTAAAELNAPYTVQEKAEAAWKAVRRGVEEGPHAVQAKAQQLAAAGRDGVERAAAGLRARGQQALEQAQGAGREARSHLAAAAAGVRAKVQGWLPPGKGGSA